MKLDFLALAALLCLALTVILDAAKLPEPEYHSNVTQAWREK